MQRGEVCPRTYVVFDDKVKNLFGLKLPLDFMPKDYYMNAEKANDQATKNKANKVVNADPISNVINSTEPSTRSSTTVPTNPQTSSESTNQTVKQPDTSLAAQATVDTAPTVAPNNSIVTTPSDLHSRAQPEPAQVSHTHTYIISPPY